MSPAAPASTRDTLSSRFGRVLLLEQITPMTQDPRRLRLRLRRCGPSRRSHGVWYDDPDVRIILKGRIGSGDGGGVNPCVDEGPDVAFTSLFNRNYPDIAAYCRRRLPPEQAADATSEIFVVAWDRFAEIPTGNESRLWLFGVARHKVMHQRRQSASRSRLLDRLKAVPQRRSARADEGDDLADVLAAAARLPDDDLELLRLVAWDGLSHEEAGHVMDLTANAVAIRLHRIRKKLKARASIADEPSRTATAIDLEES